MAAKLKDGTIISTLQQAYEYVQSHPEMLQEFLSYYPGFAAYYNVMQAREQYDAGNIDANSLMDAYGQQSTLQMTPETEKYLDNQISRENVAQQQGYETEMRDTSYVSAARQLESVGLTSSGVLQTGGASSGVNSSAASVDTHSAANLHKQESINAFNQRLGIAKSVMGLVGQMASSGIYGSAIGAVKNAGSQLASATAHSAQKTMSVLNGKFKKSDLPRINNKVGGFYSIFE